MSTTQQLLRLAIGTANSRVATATTTITTARIASFSSYPSSSASSSLSTGSTISMTPLTFPTPSSVSAASQWWRSRNKQQQLPMTAMKAPVSSIAGAASQCCGMSRREFSVSARMASGGEHADETYEEFTIRYEKEFDAVNDVFDLQRNLNNAFAYDLVPAPSVIVAALRAARRVNDFPTAVRIFEGIKAKVENKMQYEEYVKELEPLREELGVPLKESLYPDLP